jgi:hypothetical protein
MNFRWSQDYAEIWKILVAHLFISIKFFLSLARH